jgi:NAD(P)-dependent dehydrogenase (short-subunit alcohol dehydrogenase family)
MGLLDDKTAVITGGNSGIGLATAKRLAAEGAFVFVTGRRQAELDAAVKEIGDNAVGVRGDVASAEDLDRLYRVVADHGRGIDVLFANAAVIDVARLGEITGQHLDHLLDIDFKGLVFTVQKALPLLNDRASVILNSSNANAKGSEAFGVYAAIKAAVRSLARTWASELRDRGIRVNAVSPGATDTPGLDAFARQLHPGPDALAEFDRLTAAIPMGRRGEPEEVANAVLFLASELSSYTTGAEIPVDGGINQI